MANTKVLIVEDDSYIRSIFETKFRDYNNFDLSFAVTGADAKEIIQNKSPELILLDLILPDMSGEDLLDDIKKSCPNAKVLIVTNIASKANAEKFMEKGIKDYFVKSSDSFFDIIDMIDRYIKEIESSRDK